MLVGVLHSLACATCEGGECLWNTACIHIHICAYAKYMCAHIHNICMYIYIYKKLLDILNQALTAGRIPQEWQQALVVEIYKGKGSTADPNNYRPISLLSTAYKLMARILQQAWRTTGFVTHSLVSAQVVPPPNQSTFYADCWKRRNAQTTPCMSSCLIGVRHLTR